MTTGNLNRAYGKLVDRLDHRINICWKNKMSKCISTNLRRRGQQCCLLSQIRISGTTDKHTGTSLNGRLHRRWWMTFQHVKVCETVVGVVLLFKRKSAALPKARPSSNMAFGAWLFIIRRDVKTSVSWGVGVTAYIGY
jgi:hypothetical protein